jgi:hypothetical protein
MRFLDCKRLRASAAGFLILPLVFSMGAAARAAAQQSGSSQQQPSIPAQSPQSQSSPATTPQGQTGPDNASHSASEAQQNGAASPLGTAAAPKEEVTGVMGSRPAGAAIAPAKQRRFRTIFIKVGAVIGAGVAIGTVAALSKGSPSRPH